MRFRCSRPVVLVGVLAAFVAVPAPTAALAQGNPANGKSVFTANCSACHTLKAANAVGTIGPNLDQTKPSESLTRTLVTNGRNAMPAFKGILTATQINDVAAFVASATGSGGQTQTTTQPAKTTPTKTTPAQTTPTQTATQPAKTTPAKTTPAKTTPAKTTPAKTTPAQTTPAQTTTEQATTEQATPSSSSGGSGGSAGGSVSSQSPPSSSLPSTGFDVLPLAVLAAGLCALGLLLLVRRSSNSDV